MPDLMLANLAHGSLDNEQIERFKKKLRRREEIAQFGRAITKS
jgi:hypothetical protein